MKENIRVSMTRDKFARLLNQKNKQLCKTAKDLNAVLDDMVKLSEQEIRAATAEAVVKPFGKLIDQTPIATGRARAGWQIIAEQGDLEFEPGTSPQKIAAAAAGAVPPAQNLTQADVIWVVNNVEYILPLNAGWSQSAPGGFIDNYVQAVGLGLADAARKS